MEKIQNQSVNDDFKSNGHAYASSNNNANNIGASGSLFEDKQQKESQAQLIQAKVSWTKLHSETHAYFWLFNASSTRLVLLLFFTCT